MNPLDLLKIQLQDKLTNRIFDPYQNAEFNQALSDAIYGCDLSVKALETWINNWVTPKYLDYASCDNYSYIKGVEFVEQEWYKITGMF